MIRRFRSLLHTLKGRTALSAALLAAVGIAAMTSIQARFSERTVLASIIAQHEHQTQQVAAEFDRQFRSGRVTLSEFASNISTEQMRSPGALGHYLNLSVGLQQRFESVAIYDAQGMLVLARQPGISESVAHEAWFISAAANGGTPTVGVPGISRMSGEPVVGLAYPIHDEDGNLMGVVYGTIPLNQKDMWAMPVSADAPDAARFMLITAEGLIALHPDKQLTSRPLRAVGDTTAMTIERGMTDPARPTIVTEDKRGMPTLYAFRPIQSARWVLVGVVTNERAYTALSNLSQSMLIAGALFAALLFPAMWLMVSRTLQPLDNLGRQMQRLREAGSSSAESADAPSPLLELPGEFTGMALAWQSAEQSLQHEKERAEVTLQSIADGVVATDREGRISAANVAAARLLGANNDDLVGRPFHEVFCLVSDKDEQPLPDLCLNAMQQGQPLSYEGASLKQPGGTLCPIQNSAAPIHAADGTVDGAVIVFRDIAAERAAAQELQWRATHDSMTGLCNRGAYEEALKGLCASIRPEDRHAVLMLDLDRFKIVNDTCGHAVGDELIIEIARLLTRLCRRSDLVARLGGDEFAILMYHCPMQQASVLAEKIRRAVADLRFQHGSHVFRVGASIGSVEINADFCDPVEAMTAVDMACYVAKNSGRNRVHLHTGTDAQVHAAKTEMQVLTQVRAAIEQDRLRLFAQPIKPIDRRQVEGLHFEILIRMLSEEGKFISPADFLPVAERYGLMDQIDQWVVENTARQLAAHFGPDRWEELDTVSINLSATTLQNAEIGDFIVSCLRRHKVPFGCVCFEVTETAAIANLEDARRLMDALRAQGLRFALDDFGVGMTSLAQLRHLPIDVLKIDGSFVADIDQDTVNTSLVQAVQMIAQCFSMDTVAERVENASELQRLAELGVRYAQGYLMAKPMPLSQLLEAPQPKADAQPPRAIEPT